MKRILLCVLPFLLLASCTKDGCEEDLGGYVPGEMVLQSVSYFLDGVSDGFTVDMQELYKESWDNTGAAKMEVERDPVSHPAENYQFVPNPGNTIPEKVFSRNIKVEMPRIQDGQLVRDGKVITYGEFEYSEKKVTYPNDKSENFSPIEIPSKSRTSVVIEADVYTITVSYRAEYKSSRTGETATIDGKWKGVQSDEVRVLKTTKPLE